MRSPLPANEVERLRAVESYGILDTPPEKIFDDLARIAASICGTEVALVSIMDKDRQWFKAKIGWVIKETPREVAFCSHTVLSSEIMIVPDALEDERFADNPLVTQKPHIRFYAGMPLINTDGHALGTICVIDHEPRRLTAAQEVALRVLATSAVGHLELRKAHRLLKTQAERLEEEVRQRTRQLEVAKRRIEMSYDDTLRALGAALDMRDNETAGHSRRVTAYCLQIAKAVGVQGDELKNIERGSYLHDIGKIGIPDAILFKPAKLTEEERKVMESHARIGYDLVGSIAFLSPAAQIALTHQERYDGTGYPQGLAGKEIPLGARIFAVADTLDAMTSDRPYRRALPLEAAREEIKRESGRQFDPEVVRAFLSIPEEVLIGIRAGVENRGNNLESVEREP
ncbi:MAG: HD domain-containing protein [Acidobacteria bacterium]|nr:HD domain-containing protein [Acidobacteriota bacterium]